MDNAAMLGVIVPSIAIVIGLMLVAYGPHIDAFQRGRGDGDFLWARVPAGPGGSSQSQQGVVALGLAFYFSDDRLADA
jgi:hypothetical protein